jgi:hypothetical protein
VIVSVVTPVALAVFPAVGFAAVVAGLAVVLAPAAVVGDGLFLVLLHAAATTADKAMRAAMRLYRLRDNAIFDISEIPLSRRAIRRESIAYVALPR